MKQDKERELDASLAERDRKIRELEAALADRDRRIAALESAQTGLLWELLCAYRRAKDRAFPYGSRRRACYDFMLESFKVVKLLIRPPVPGQRIYLLRPIYHRLPLSLRQKQHLKALIGPWILPKQDPLGDVQRPALEPPFPLEVRPQPTNTTTSVLFLCDWLPAMDRASGALRMFTILQMLREKGYDVTLGADHDKLEHVSFLGSAEAVNRYEVALGRVNIKIFYGFGEIMRHLYEQGHLYDFVFLSFPEVAYRYLPCARAYAVHARVIYDPVDLHWVRLEREAAIKDDRQARQKAEDYQKIERFNTAAADLVIAITGEEKGQLLAAVPNAEIEVIPNIHQCVDSPEALSGRKDLFFIGYFMHTPNEDAVIYFVEKTFPLIRQQLPEVVFHIVGSGMTDAVKALAQPGVIPVGYVPDPSIYFHRCRVFVAPLRFGAGMKGKIGQSMSFGLPVVTTSIGAEGMHLIDGRHALIADSPEDFARAVVELYGDDRLWETLSIESLAHVRAHFSKTAVQAKLAEVFAPAPQRAACSVIP